MEVIKRNGKREKVDLNKITKRIRDLAVISPSINVDPVLIASKTVSGLYDGIKTDQLDRLAWEVSASMISYNPDYDTLAARLVVSDLHKSTLSSFVEKTTFLYKIGLLDKSYYEYVVENFDYLESIIDYSRDYLFDYFGITTLKKSYLLRDSNGKIVERPQDMFLRVSVFLHRENKEEIKKTYTLLSLKKYIHATPTLFNAGTVKPQLSSCFLLDMEEDSIEGIYNTLKKCAKISQSAGGIGISISKIRAKGSYISGTNGFSNGIVPMLRVFDATARYVDQGGGRRKGSMAIYIEPWHSDIFEFLDLKKNHGKEELRARDLFYALWVPDLFMEQVKNDGDWYLFDPAKAFITDKNGNKKYLYDLYGEDFNNAYHLLVDLKQYKSRIKARTLWEKILVSQTETGTPYMLYKDSANRKSNQSNLGTIKSSNLCSEIIEYTSPDEIAVCNLASISLPAYVVNGEVDYEGLYNLSRHITYCLNKVIDLTYYPVEEAKRSNLRHRPIGIGVQGLADLFAILKLPFLSQEARDINVKIFETIYKGAVDESIELAKRYGTYESYQGSPASNGFLQFDLWGMSRDKLYYDWSETFKNLKAYGLRNSLLLAPMPTASTSQILGNNECFEPFTSNLYIRRTLAGEFIVINKHLVRELIELNLWNDSTRNSIMLGNGSIQHIEAIPLEVKERYLTVWELKMRGIIDMAADRGPFICQSQSLNLFVRDVTMAKLTSMHFYAWERGLKTGMYYLRTEAARDAIKFTVQTDNTDKKSSDSLSCQIDRDGCIMCSA